MAEKQLTRKEVPENLTWKLEDIYPNREAAATAMEEAMKIAEEMEKKYRGRLNAPSVITECLQEYRRTLEIIDLVSNYSDLAYSVDYQDDEAQNFAAMIGNKIATWSAKVSFIDAEVGQCPKEVLEEAARLDQSNAGYLGKIMRHQPHRLSPETEKVLAAFGQTFETAYEIYNVAKLGDMTFPNFIVDGKEYPLGYSLFEDDYEYVENTEVRRAAFQAFSKKLRDYVRITATAYNAQVQMEKTDSVVRNYQDVFESLLIGQRVPRELYDRQIDVIMEKLAPHMRRYAKLLQKIHHLDKMTYADLKLPVDPGYSPQVSIEGAKEYILKGLSVMGDEYVATLKEALENRWVDFAKNVGKCTGGYCASPYGKHCYILLNWNDRMSDVFTLAHELGHAGHFQLCNKAQSIFDVEVSNYFVEAPSTMNEILMGRYLLKTNDDKRFRRWVLSNVIGNTYYHNFVTHLLEAAFQREVYKIVDQGGSVQAETLSGIMKSVLERFWGDAVELTEGAELTWMRQPHYYMGLYSYTYSAGLTIATQVADRIEREGQKAIEDWKRVMMAGSTLDPIEFAREAGVDVTTEEPLLKTIDAIGKMIDEIINLTDEI